MGNLSAGLKLYEVILMIMGCLLFIALIFLLIWNVTRQKGVKGLLPFFAVPVVMVGFSAIQSVSFDSIKIDLKNQAAIVNANPADTTGSKKLVDMLKDVDADRLKTDPEALSIVANAQSALGNYDSAFSAANKALALKSDYQPALEQKKNIEKEITIRKNWYSNIGQLENHLKTIETSGQASPDKANSIAQILTTMKPPVYVDKQSSLVLAKALAFVRKTDRAEEVVTKIVEKDPGHQEALNFKTDLETLPRPAPSIHPELLRELDKSAVVNANSKKLIITNFKYVKH